MVKTILLLGLALVAAAQTPQRGGTAVFSLNQDPTSVNPDTSTNVPDRLIGCIPYQGLIHLTPDYKVEPLLAREVGDAETAAEIHLRHHVAEFVGDALVEAEHAPRGHLEARGVEDLAADVGVQADQLEGVGGQHPSGRFERGTGGDREPELLVLVRGGDELVGVGLDAGRHPHHHPGVAAQFAGDAGEALDLVVGVDHDASDTEGDRTLELAHRLVVAVHHTVVGRNTRGKSDEQFATGCDIEQQSLFVGEAGHFLAEKRLGCVYDVSAAEFGYGLAATVAQVCLVVNEHGCSVFGSQVIDTTPTDRQVAV